MNGLRSFHVRSRCRSSGNSGTIRTPASVFGGFGVPSRRTERLTAINSLRIYGKAPGKGAIVSFDLEGIHSHDVAMVIDREGVAVRAGTHCAQPLLKRFGATSTCRASFGLYNTRGEVDSLAEALEKARRFFA